MIIEYIATALSLTGAGFNACGNVIGFFIWTSSNILWIRIGIENKLYGFVFLQAIYMCFCFVGIFRWLKKRKKVA